MIKIKIFVNKYHHDVIEQESKINEFINDKIIIQMSVVPESENYYQTLVFLYEDKESSVL